MENVIAGLTFAEGLRWRDSKLWFSDMYANEIHAWSEQDGDTVVVRTEHSPSGLGWTDDGELLISSMEDRKLLRADSSGCLTTFAELGSYTPNPINDLVTDVDGRAYIGEFGFDLHGGGELATGMIVRIEPDGSHGVAADDLLFPNGMVIADRGRTLVVAETFGGRLTSFSITEDGSLTGREVWAELPAGVTPDGICIDAEGAIWVSSTTTSECLRVLEGGSVTERLGVGPRMAIACCLGGDDGRTLFIATSVDLAPDVCRQTRQATIVSCRVEVGAAEALL